MEKIKSTFDETDVKPSPCCMERNGPETINGIVITSPNLKVKVTKEPDFVSEVIEVLRDGDKVTILDKVYGHYKISTSVNKVAYIPKIFVKEV